MLIIFEVQVLTLHELQIHFIMHFIMKACVTVLVKTYLTIISITVQLPT